MRRLAPLVFPVAAFVALVCVVVAMKSGSWPYTPMRALGLCLFFVPVTAVVMYLDYRSHRRRWRARRGQCLRCGYDLRASKDRCPECGEIAVGR